MTLPESYFDGNTIVCHPNLEQKVLALGSGVPVFASDSVPEFTVNRVQVRFPVSKRKRIRRKWAKDPKNWTERKQRVFYVYNLRNAMLLWKPLPVLERPDPPRDEGWFRFRSYPMWTP